MIPVVVGVLVAFVILGVVVVVIFRSRPDEQVANYIARSASGDVIFDYPPPRCHSRHAQSRYDRCDLLDGHDGDHIAWPISVGSRPVREKTIVWSDR